MSRNVDQVADRPEPKRSGLWRFIWPFRKAEPAQSDSMAGPNRLIIGLGNPGPDYDDTRHNVGFDVIDAIAEKISTEVRDEAAVSFIGEGRWRGRPIALAKPLTFMNRSGQAYQALRRRYGITPKDILVVYDDIALPPGTIRLREKGSAGGHNGVQNIIDHLNSTDFPRLRVGVGDSFPRGGQVRYVLDPFSEEQLPDIKKAIDLAVEASLSFARDGLTTAMNRYNRRA